MLYFPHSYGGNMSILFGILCGAIALFILFLVARQFYKLGGILKDKHPLVHRLYVIFWSLIGLFLAICLLVATWAQVDNYTKDRDADEFFSIMDSSKDVDVKAAYIIINDSVKKNGYISSIEIERISGILPDFNNTYKQAIKESGVDGYRAESKLRYLARKYPTTTKEIESRFYEIGYWQKPEEKILSADDAVQILEQQESVHETKIYNEVEPQTKYHHASDVFISPDLQEKIGVDIYGLKGMIADARNAKKQDKEIFDMLKETIQYGAIIKEYEENGLSKSDIAEKFGLSI